MDTLTLEGSATKSSADWQSLQIAARQELARRNPNSLLDWSLAYRFFRGKPMRLIPALKDLYRDPWGFIVIQKAAQVGISEFLINTALWVADTCQAKRGNALYVMPTQGQMDDFSQGRFDRAIAESPYLTERLHPPPPQKSGPARLRLKRLGRGYIYLRGADSRRQLTSVDADVVLLDEYDLMGEGVLELAQRRLASSWLRALRVASTPRLPEAGINALFLQSDQRYYFLKCPACGHTQHLEWERNVDHKRAQVVCQRSRCRKPLDLWAPGQWEAARPGNDIHGYHLNRLYAPWTELEAMIEASKATTPKALQEFHNSDLGETFVPPGGQLSIGDLDACRRDYEMAEEGWHEPTDMGVDVGLKLHAVVRTRPDDDGRTQALFIGEIASFEVLDRLMEMYRVRICVIDALPDTHKAREFAKRWGAKVYLAYYDRHEGDHEWSGGWSSTDEGTVHINRTQALDEMFDRFKQGKAELPANARQLGGWPKNGIGEYYREMTALNRTLVQDAQGNWVARYVDPKKADHYAHAEVYCLLAGKASAPGGRIHRIRTF